MQRPHPPHIYAKRLGLKDKVRRIIEDGECYLDPNFSIHHLARELGTNRSYTSSLFKKEFGKTFSNFINSYRIKRAEQLLRKNTMPLGEIWRNVGFGSSLTYRRAFALKHNMTPGQYRELYATKGKHPNISKPLLS